MSDTIARQLSGIYRELGERRPYSAIARVELTEAGAWGRARQLLIGQCDIDGLTLLSIYAWVWVVDEGGFRPESSWPLTQDLVAQDDWMNEMPVIKFASDGRRVRFGMKFGPQWYVAREGPINASRGFDPEDLIDPYSH